RQAYSHSASLGKRYKYPLSRYFSFNFLRNACTSSHDTCSTGNSFSSSSEMSRTLPRPPPLRENQLGLLPTPMIVSHCPCVTSCTAITKSSLISVFFAEPGVPSQPM